MVIYDLQAIHWSRPHTCKARHAELPCIPIAAICRSKVPHNRRWARY